MLIILPLLALLLYPLTIASLAQTETPGYHLRFNQVQINTADHWQAWEAPNGVRQINADGSVEPRFLRRNINALK